ncbi:hypothetical protein JCM11251_006654 [Rhodosporidiobolus azoricus]
MEEERLRTSTKTLPTAAHLASSALHPHLSLVALSSPPPSSSSQSPPPPPSVTLYRTAPPSLKVVWTWSPPAPPVDPSAPQGQGGAAPPKKGLAAMRAAMMAKNKAAGAGAAAGAGGATGTIEALRWSPDGQTLSVLVSPLASPPSSTPSTLHLICLDTGLSLSPSPLSLPPTNPPSRLTTLSWLSLPSSAFPPSSCSSTWSERLISSLPALPPLPAEGSSSTSSASSGPGGGPGAGLIGGGGHIGGHGGAGVFGAKQAMLERERAKEAQRVLSVAMACPAGWPKLLSSSPASHPADQAERVSGAEGERWTLLVVGTSAGKVHLFLSGSIFLGTLSLPSPSPLLGVSLLPSSSTPTLSLLSPSTAHPTPLHLPASLPPLLSLSTSLHTHLSHTLSSIQSARQEWDEARRLGKSWMQRIADVSRPHGVLAPPGTQLLTLLVTGRASAALSDFLSSKMNERGLGKWEQAMGSALEKLRRVGWMNVTPALERGVILLMELEGWTRWPSRASIHGLDTEETRLAILRALELAKEVIGVTARMRREVEEEERCFVHFGRWLRYELDKLAHADSAATDQHDDKRPLASFAPLPVAHYIRHCLPILPPPPAAASAAQPAPPVEGSKVTPFLQFGLATLPLDQNPELDKAKKWVEGVVPSATSDSPAFSGAEAEEKERARVRLEKRLRRLKEELRGQVAEEELEQDRAQRLVRGRGRGRDGPTRDFDVSMHAPIPSSLYASPPSPASAFHQPPTPPHPSFSASTAQLDPDLEPMKPPSSTLPLPTSRMEATQSIPAMLHLLASLVGGVLDRAVKASLEVREGKVVKIDEGQARGELTAGRGGEEQVRVRAHEEWEVRVEGEMVRFSRVSPGDARQAQHAAFSLTSPDGAKLRVLGFEFLSFSRGTPSAREKSEGRGSDQVVFAFEAVKEGAPPIYSLSLLPLSSIPSSSFIHSPASSPPYAHQPLPVSPSLTHPLRPPFPPTAISLTLAADFEGGASATERRKGEEKVRVRVAMIGGEGRRVEVVEVEFGLAVGVREGGARGVEGGDVEMQ